jgi:hypothetical protein
MSAVPNFHSKFPLQELDSQHSGFIKLGRINEIKNDSSVWSASVKLHEFEHYESFLDYVPFCISQILK